MAFMAIVSLSAASASWCLHEAAVAREFAFLSANRVCFFAHGAILIQGGALCPNHVAMFT